MCYSILNVERFSRSKMVQCDRDCIQFDGTIILDIPKREVRSNVDNPTLQIKTLTLTKDNMESPVA